MLQADTRISLFGGNIHGLARLDPAGNPPWGAIGVDSQEGSTDEDQFQIHAEDGASFIDGLLTKIDYCHLN